MKLNLFLLCLVGVFLINLQAVRRDYVLITTPVIWDDAKTYCRNHYEDLAWVETADNWYKYRLTAEAERNGLPVTGWIGLYNRVNDWFWINDGLTTAQTMPVDNWVLGQPDNLGGNETCVAEDSSGSWLDYKCAELKNAICYDANLGDFVTSNSLLSWQQSREYCWFYHVDLAFPITTAHSDAIHQLVLSHGTSWIGVFRPSWAWTNDTDALDIPWRSGHPNNIDHYDDCGSVVNGLVEDKPCTSTFKFFCHKTYTGKQQVMRLKVQGDNTVFDPATQLAIFQQIKQKLQEHGMTWGMNVTWRVFADGNIFRKTRKDEL